MKAFQSLAVVRQPVELVWETVRDRLPELGHRVDDIESITLLERTALDDGTTRLVNEWKTSRSIPQVLAKSLDTSEVGWIDTAVWDPATMTCRWSIEPTVLTGQIRCQGTTSYESAMGGRGSRVGFEGTFDLAPGALSGLAKPLERPMTAFVESIVSTLIPTNLRKIVEGAAQLISESG